MQGGIEMEYQKMVQIAQSWAGAKAQFLQGIAYAVGFSPSWYQDEYPEELKPYAEILDVAGAQIVAQMSGVAKPMAVLEAIAEGASSAAHEASEKAREAAYAAGKGLDFVRPLAGRRAVRPTGNRP